MPRQLSSDAGLARTSARLILLPALFGGLAGVARAQALPATGEPPAQPADCRRLLVDAERLACYDRTFGVLPAGSAGVARRPGGVSDASAAPAEEPVVAPVDASLPMPTASYLEEAWELTPATRHSALTFQPYRPSYILPLHVTDSVNNQPVSPTRAVPANAGGLKAAELSFQLSFKTRLLSDLLKDGPVRGGDLWFGYTQTSYLQSYNKGLSSPFRETDYEPELVFSLHPDAELAGWRWRVLNLGYAHQSNGRTVPLSRSWNRLYIAAGIERGDLALIVRPWWRTPESRGDDDNPDIARYIGRVELQGVWSPGRQRITLTARGTPGSDDARGSVALDWSFPIWSRLRGYARMFSGYGESLIDYNHRQNSLGLGVSLAE
ncbi:phospholipase A [Derxia gummosa]|uniref:Phospholipase A1 n=1 Tax=Derxia gummosa DSM 723 TaxID=1121388 RepID=A0A8B6XA23_9BURK|nr:phospholipase A [Derxia gummosa]